MINRDNYELYFFQYQEGMLSPEERAAVEQFALQHPDLGEELALYDKSLTLPALNATYPDKAALLPRKRQPLVIPLWQKGIAAAVAALTLATTLTLVLHKEPEQGEQIAQAVTSTVRQKEACQPIAPQEAPLAPAATHRTPSAAPSPNTEAPTLLASYEDVHEAIAESPALDDNTLADNSPLVTTPPTVIYTTLIHEADDTIAANIITFEDPSLFASIANSLQRRWEDSEPRRLMGSMQHTANDLWLNFANAIQADDGHLAYLVAILF